MSGPHEITFPNRSATPSSAFTQQTLDRLTAKILSWRQAPGVFGGLHLHSCWGEASVLTRRYHGQTVPQEAGLVFGAMALYERTQDAFWRQLAGHIASNILFLQAPEGGFIHASNEFEPTFTCRETCPIAQGRPINSLLAYAAWPHADPAIKELIEPAVRRFWAYMSDYWWRRGNGWLQPLDRDGWCGVTNQDFVIVESMARFGTVYGDWSEYDRYGKPALDAYFSPRMYHASIGLFERGDQANFAERTAYYNVILGSLRVILGCAGDERIPGIIENVSERLFDAFYVDDAGNAQVAWGAKTDPTDKSRVMGWINKPIVLPGYPELIHNMRLHLAKHPDPTHSWQVDAIEHTLASWVFADGTVPSALAGADPLFEIVPNNCFEFWDFLIGRLGKEVHSPAGAAVLPVARTRGGLTYRSDDLTWSIHKDGQRLFAGLRSEPSGVVIGHEELRGIDFKNLEKIEYTERVKEPLAKGDDK